jgi:hypothetical protein
MAALLVGEKCSRTSCTLRLFSNSRLALDQNLAILKPIQVGLSSNEVLVWFNRNGGEQGA